jgi:hypothetical protein
MSALTIISSLNSALFPTKPFCFHKMALEIVDRISVVGPLEQLDGLQLVELVGPQLR